MRTFDCSSPVVSCMFRVTHLEAHVQHPIRLIQNQTRHLAQRHTALGQQVAQPSGSSDHQIDATR